MADNKTLPLTGAGDATAKVATDEVTHSGDISDVQIVRQGHVTGAEGAKTIQPVTQSTGSAVPAAGVAVGGTDGTNLRLIKLGTGGVIDVPAPLNVSGPGSEATALRVSIGRPASAYCYMIPSQVHVAVANTVHWDMFNADPALIVRVVSIRQIPNITTAVTGIVFDWLLERTTAVGTGGVAQTAWLADLNDTALDVDITCRSKPTGGATASTDLFNYSLSSEETLAATIHVASIGGLELVPIHLQPDNGGKGIVLRQNQGIRCVQITSSNAGNTGWLISFTVE